MRHARIRLHPRIIHVRRGRQRIHTRPRRCHLQVRVALRVPAPSPPPAPSDPLGVDPLGLRPHFPCALVAALLPGPRRGVLTRLGAAHVEHEHRDPSPRGDHRRLLYLELRGIIADVIPVLPPSLRVRQDGAIHRRHVHEPRIRRHMRVVRPPAVHLRVGTYIPPRRDGVCVRQDVAAKGSTRNLNTASLVLCLVAHGPAGALASHNLPRVVP
ncbi:hypothetical protein T484DRAFT_1923521 [Baffinella frigidus]|nr:hypothetical protein T484DRAFT_1923521 [Cryptophyta sp. CCMP2293]